MAAFFRHVLWNSCTGNLLGLLYCCRLLCGVWDQGVIATCMFVICWRQDSWTATCEELLVPALS